MVASPAPCLLLMRSQVDARWPGRSKASDGIMGDPAHQRRKSDHNLGNAIDLTDSPAHGFDSWLFADELRRQMAAYPAGRLSYVISRVHVASPRSNWLWRPYKGTNPHRSHVHLSIKADRRSEMRPWSLG